MTPSRRVVLRCIGASSFGLSTGCTANELSTHDSGTADRSDQEGNGSTIEVRLRGPETDQLLFDDTDISKVGSIRNRNGAFQLPVTLTDDAAATVSDTFRKKRVDKSTDKFEVVIRHDGSVVNRFGIASGFATSITDRGWDGSFVLTFDQRSNATEVRDLLA